MTKLPTRNQAVIGDPDLREAVEEMLDPYSGDDLELAQMAVRDVVESEVTGSFGELRETYRDAIEEAVA